MNRILKVVHVNSTDVLGGAAIACMNISNTLNKVGISSSVLVQKKLSRSNSSIQFLDSPIKKIKYLFRFFEDYFSIYFLTIKERGRFSFPFFGTDISNHPLVKDADIIHLHWINGGFFSFKTFKGLSDLNKPIIWTLHDMWAFTGGCHYSGGCTKYLTECNNCPSLKIRGKKDFSFRIFNRKKNYFKRLNLNVVTCSNWLADEAGKSLLLKNNHVDVVPNPIDLTIYKPEDKKAARQRLNLAIDKKLILFGTMTLKEERKGFKYLQNSLNILYEKYPELRSSIEILVFGSVKKNGSIKIPFRTHFLGRISDINKLVSSYNSADIFVAPSIEDNLPNTVMEALACGIPVAAFNIGGMPDMIEHEKNGFLAEPNSSESLAEGIAWLLNQIENMSEFRKQAREKVVRNFAPEIVGNQYKKIYQSVLKNTKQS